MKFSLEFVDRQYFKLASFNKMDILIFQESIICAYDYTYIDASENDMGLLNHKEETLTRHSQYKRSAVFGAKMEYIEQEEGRYKFWNVELSFNDGTAMPVLFNKRSAAFLFYDEISRWIFTDKKYDSIVATNNVKI